MDQIFVKDFVHETEIGVYQSEFGKKQRLRFNVFLTIDYDQKNKNDNIENVITYEIILRAIEKHTSEGRLYLLETLANKISDTCFSDSRIKKIDMLAGQIGKEIRMSVFNYYYCFGLYLNECAN